MHLQYNIQPIRSTDGCSTREAYLYELADCGSRQVCFAIVAREQVAIFGPWGGESVDFPPLVKDPRGYGTTR